MRKDGKTREIFEFFEAQNKPFGLMKAFGDGNPEGCGTFFDLPGHRRTILLRPKRSGHSTFSQNTPTLHLFCGKKPESCGRFS